MRSNARRPPTSSDCSTRSAPAGRTLLPLFPSLENVDERRNQGWSYYADGEIETLWVLDVDGTIIIINTRVAADQPAAAHAEFAAVLDSIRIDRP